MGETDGGVLSVLVHPALVINVCGRIPNHHPTVGQMQSNQEWEVEFRRSQRLHQVYLNNLTRREVYRSDPRWNKLKVSSFQLYGQLLTAEGIQRSIGRLSLIVF